MTAYSMRLCVTGLVIFLLTLVVYFPADRASHFLSAYVPETVIWQKLDGTLFAPTFHNTTLLITDGRRLQLDRIHLHLFKMPLIAGQIKFQFDIEVGDGQIHGTAILNKSSWQIPKLEGDIALMSLTNIAPEMVIAGVGGRAIFKGSRIAGDLQGRSVTGQLDLMIESLQLGMLNSEKPVGSYMLVLQGTEDKGIHGTLNTKPAEAQLSVQGQLVVDLNSHDIHFEGRAGATGSATDAVRSLLPLLGKMESDQANIVWHTRL